MTLLSFTRPIEDKSYRYFTIGNFYLIKTTKNLTVSLGERCKGKHLDLSIGDLDRLQEFIRTILMLKFSDKNSSFISRSIYFGTNPKIYFMYTKDQGLLTVGVYDNDEIAKLDLDDVLELKKYLTHIIRIIKESDDLPF